MSLRKASMGELHAKYQTTSTVKQYSAPPVAMVPFTKAHNNVPSTVRDRPLPPVPQEQFSKPPSPERPRVAPASSSKSRKRKSEDIVIASDKENDPADDQLPVAKNHKRPKAGPTGSQISKHGNPNNVLSPRSHNSRTLRRSPVKENAGTNLPSSPYKQSYIARPVSPLKPPSPFKTAATAATSAISASFHGMVEHAKRGTNATAGKMSRTASREKTTTTATGAGAGKMLPPARPGTASSASSSSSSAAEQRTVSQSSTHSASSNTSISTTVVKKAGAAGKVTTTLKSAAVGPAKRPATAKTTSAMKKGPATAGATTTGLGKKVVVAEPAAGRRVLRKRQT